MKCIDLGFLMLAASLGGYFFFLPKVNTGLARHSQIHHALCKCICFACWSAGESIHSVVCRVNTIPASRSRVALGDDTLRSAKVPLFQRVKIVVVDVDRLLEPALGERLWQNRKQSMYQLHCTPSLQVSSSTLGWLSRCCVTLRSSDWSYV